MSLDLVLNDLSFVPCASRQQAQERMSELMQTITYLGAMGVKGSMRYSPVLFNQSLSSDYSVTDWINDSQVDRDTRRKFLTTATKSPFLADEPLAEAKNLGYEFTFGGEQCDAFGAAYLLDAPAISLNTNACWQTEALKIQISQLVEHSEDIVEFESAIVHAATPTHALAHQNWIRQRLSSPIKTGTDIWTNRQMLYPRIEFCVEVEKQLRLISLPSDLKQIQYRLEALQ